MDRARAGRIRTAVHRLGRTAVSEAARPTGLLTIDEAAEYLHVPARWVADAVRARKVRCTRIGKHVRFRIEHLEELIAAGEQPVSAEVVPRRSTRRSRL